MAHQGYGFCEFQTEEDAEYACKIMNQIKLWGKPIRVNKVRGRFFTTQGSLTCHLIPLSLSIRLFLVSHWLYWRDTDHLYFMVAGLI